MKDKPLISVIIPTHNNEHTLGVAIQSILDQTYPNIEIIIVNDNSTDKTEDVAKDYENKYSNVKYFKLPFDDPYRFNKRGRNINAGYMSRNFALEKISGEWVTFQDGDDASLINRIEVQYNLAKKYNSSHVCIQWQQYQDEFIGKKLDVDSIFREHQNVVIETKTILKTLKRSKGIIVPFLGPINFIIPFEFKRLRFINKLFFGNLDPYPASGNCPLVETNLAKKALFRPLHKRIWPSFMGRGADRDFNFRVAEICKNSVSFNLPIYLWRMERQNPDFIGYEKYII
jgi:glycosyltransferase involved in cell wall biosynthesis